MTLEELPTLNALLNLTASILLLIAWKHVKAGRIEAHKRMMIAAFVTSTLFFASYILYHAQIGSKPFPGTGVTRTIYFSILIPHIVLAAAVPPLAIISLRRGLIRNDVAHRRIAKITLPIWLFVSVTGVIVYLMLYPLAPQG